MNKETREARWGVSMYSHAIALLNWQPVEVMQIIDYKTDAIFQLRWQSGIAVLGISTKETFRQACISMRAKHLIMQC